jgi:hypothetical protein
LVMLNIVSEFIKFEWWAGMDKIEVLLVIR